MIRLKAVVHAIYPVRSNQFLNLNWTLGCEIETRFGNIATIQHNDKRIEDIVMHIKKRDLALFAIFRKHQWFQSSCAYQHLDCVPVC